MTSPTPRLYAEFAAFVKGMLLTRDLVNEYLVMRELGKHESVERRLWLTELYLVYCVLPSAVAVWARYPEPADFNPVALLGWKLPIGTERRGFRQFSQLKLHLDSYLAWVAGYGGSQARWWRRDFIEAPEVNYDTFWARAGSVRYNGRWAAFKWCELARYVNDLPIAAPDMRLQYGSGPKWGLMVLYETTTNDLAELNALGADLRARLALSTGEVLDWEHLETALCNFHSYIAGRYYVGHDIDRMAAEIEAAPGLTPEWKGRLYAAREAALPAETLGEKNGWKGVRKGRMGAARLELAL